MDKHLIFVYGTLKRGLINNYIIKNQKYIGVGTTSPDWQMYNLGNYPGVISGNERIAGELWLVDDATFKHCDWLEGHPDFYERFLIPVVSDSEDDKEVEAWMYVYKGNVDNYQQIGEWL